jgi:hypothetical protein
MSPFRDAPQVELGPLDVGLGAAATRAMIALPRGGRVIARSRAPIAAHTAGALGSVGLLGVSTAAFVAWTSRWHPSSLSDLGLCIAGVIAGGLSLATIFRATDRTDQQLTRSGEIIGRGARRILRRMARLAERTEQTPDHFGARDVAALRRALSAAAEPEIARWIPAEVRGRAELLLARAETRLYGPGWAREDARREQVKRLLLAAAGRLADPRPAEADIAALDQAPAAGRRAPRRRIRIPAATVRARCGPEPAEALDEDEPVARAPRGVLLVRR